VFRAPQLRDLGRTACMGPLTSGKIFMIFF